MASSEMDPSRQKKKTKDNSVIGGGDPVSDGKAVELQLEMLQFLPACNNELTELNVKGLSDWASEHVNDKDSTGATALHWCCHYNEVVGVSVLLRKGADVNAKTDEGNLPVHYACNSNSSSSVDALIEAKSDISAANIQGETPLHLACMHRSIECTKLLLKHGASIETADAHGATPLHLCGYYNAAESAQSILLHRGFSAALLGARDEKGNTPLMWSMRTDAATVARLLVDSIRAYMEQHGDETEMVVTFNDVNDHGDCALFQACFFNAPQCVSMLVELGPAFVDVNIANNDSDTPLLAACYRNSYFCTERLLSASVQFGHRIELNRQNLQRETALHWAALHNSIIGLKALLALPDLDVNRVDTYGNTALHVAWKHDSLDAAKMLLAQPTIRFAAVNKNRVPPAEMATPEGRDIFDEVGREAFERGYALECKAAKTDYVMPLPGEDKPRELTPDAMHEYNKALHYYQQRVCERLSVLVNIKYKCIVYGLLGKKKDRECTCKLGLGGAMVERFSTSLFGDVKRKVQKVSWSKDSIVTAPSNTSVKLDPNGNGKFTITIKNLEANEAFWLYGLMQMTAFLHSYLWATTRMELVKKRVDEIQGPLLETKSVVDTIAAKLEGMKRDGLVKEAKAVEAKLQEAVRAYGEEDAKRQQLVGSVSKIVKDLSIIRARILKAEKVFAEKTAEKAEYVRWMKEKEEKRLDKERAKRKGDGLVKAKLSKDDEKAAQDLIEALAAEQESKDEQNVCYIKAILLALVQKSHSDVASWLSKGLFDMLPMPVNHSHMEFALPAGPSESEKAEKDGRASKSKTTETQQGSSSSSSKPTLVVNGGNSEAASRRPSHLMVRSTVTAASKSIPIYNPPESKIPEEPSHSIEYGGTAQSRPPQLVDVTEHSGNGSDEDTDEVTETAVAETKDELLAFDSSKAVAAVSAKPEHMAEDNSRYQEKKRVPRVFKSTMSWDTGGAAPAESSRTPRAPASSNSSKRSKSQSRRRVVSPRTSSMRDLTGTVGQKLQRSRSRVKPKTPRNTAAVSKSRPKPRKRVNSVSG